MGEVLSQSQIDALLSSMNSAPEEEPEKEVIKFRKYDFKTPKKFTKDRLRIVDNIYENYARIISSHLTSILRMSCTIELLSVEELRYYEFDNSLSEDDLLVFSDVTFSDVPETELENEPIMVVFSPSIITFLVGRMLGGAENRPEDTEGNAGNDTDFTEIELAVYETILEHIVPLMSDAWQSYLDMNFSYQRIETNPKLIQAFSVDEVIVLTSLSIELGERSGQITICLPSSLLDTFFSQLEKNTAALHKRKDIQKEEEKNALIAGVENSPLELITRFETASISLNDVYKLHVGDILNLHVPKDSDVQICIEEKPWFTGKLGVYKENKAIMITGAIHNEDNEE